MLCFRCGTIVLFEKEDFVKMVFQTGEKHLYHMECFTLNFVRFEDIRMKAEQTRTGALDPQGNSPIGGSHDVQATDVSVSVLSGDASPQPCVRRGDW
jgi:hypothetical protein